MATKSSGFSLVELLVVVAILGILSAVGTLTYSGYVKGTKIRATKALMQQISLAQTEEYSNTGNYFSNADADGCTNITAVNTRDIEVALLARESYEPGADGGTAKSQTGKETGYEICIENSGLNNFKIIAEEIGGGNTPCTLELNRNGQTSETNC
tara:strand:- start:344 stop:808 length:465 start_codon:yes stop_codon:yes gene_type:complete